MKAKKSTYLPLALLAYLLVMAYLGLPLLQSGQSLRYFSVFGASLAVVAAIHFLLKRKERRRGGGEEPEDDGGQK